jgi:hypothetical protein
MPKNQGGGNLLQWRFLGDHCVNCELAAQVDLEGLVWGLVAGVEVPVAGEAA